MSHPARVSLRAPPHLPFIQGFPGIPEGPSRRPPGVHGTVEVRVGAVPIKAKWVRVEIRKHETIPPGFKTSGSSSEDKTTWEHVGEIETLWKPSNPNKEFDVLETADFKFFLPLADNIPPSVNMMKDSGIKYELVAAVCYKQKGGMFKKELSSVIKSTEELRITKHELNSAWPLYNQPDTFNAAAQNGQVNLTVQRPYSAFGPNDRILLTAVLRSNQPKPFRVKGFECTLLEVVTVTQLTTPGDKRKSKKPPPPATRSRTVATARYPIDETLGKGGEKSARIEIPMTADKLLVTVRNGRTIQVGYEMEVKAVCESMPEVVVRGIKYVVGPFSRSHSQQAVRDIGHFPPLCPAPPQPQSSNPPSSRPGSPTNLQSRASPPIQPGSGTYTLNGTGSRDLGQPDFPPGFSGHPLSRPPVQGFVPSSLNDRRKSSSTITTTTTTHDFGSQSMSQPGSRPYSTMPVSAQRNSMPVPSPYQNGGLLRTPSYGSSVNTPPSPHVESAGSQSGLSKSEQEEWRSKRYSSMTTGTFGMKVMDQLESLTEHEQTGSAPSSNGARTPRQTAGGSDDVHRTPPSSWLPAEQEKQRLYNEARLRAATSQLQTGVSMQDIGMDAPPDYDTPSRHTQVPLVGPSSSSIRSIPAVVLSAAEEKEQQRLRYENARGQGDSPGGGMAGGSSGHGVSGGAISQQPTYLSAAEEKEVQKRRFEQAAARVGGSSTMSTAPLTDGGSGGMPWTHLSAAEEKDIQRKRYEEAARRAAGASETGQESISSRAVSPAPSSMVNGVYTPAPGEQPIPYDAVFPSGSPSAQNRASHPNGTMPNGMSTPPKEGQSTTALSDKEAMNRYFHAKDRRTSRIGPANPSVPASPPANSAPRSSSGMSNRPMSGSSTPPRAGPSSVALSGNEAMKRYYDQQGRGDRSMVSPISNGCEAPPPFPLGSGSGRPMSGAPLPLDEKAQMKRYYEALDKVNNPGSPTAPSGSGSASASGPSGTSSSTRTQGSNAAPSASTPLASGSSSKPQAYLSAEEEKEQMRKRYEQAATAVARTSGQGPAQPLANGSSSSSSAPPPSAIASSSNSAVPKAYLSAAEEKEQMRRRFEDAQAAVNRQSTQSGSPYAIYDSPPPPISTFSPNASGSSSKPPTSSTPAPYMSAAEEKEQMRLRFENATAAVNRKSIQSPSASASPQLGYDSPPPPPPNFSSSVGGSSSRAPAPGSGSMPAAYMTAAEEKEAMKRRFEDATAAVDRQASQPGPSTSSRGPTSSSTPSGPSGSSIAAPAKPSYPSAMEEKEMMRQRFESARAAVNRPSGSAPGSGSGQAPIAPPPRSNTSFTPLPTPGPSRQTTLPSSIAGKGATGRSSLPPLDPDAPPPPLPARPPAEYINLLSPVDDGERPPWSRTPNPGSFGMAVQGSQNAIRK